MPRRTAVTDATRVQVVQRAPSCGVRSAPASSSTMRPVSHTLINSIRAPIDRVFALLTDPGRIAQWLPGCDGVQSAGPLRKGAISPRPVRLVGSSEASAKGGGRSFAWMRARARRPLRFGTCGPRGRSGGGSAGASWRSARCRITSGPFWRTWGSWSRLDAAGCKSAGETHATRAPSPRRRRSFRHAHRGTARAKPLGP